MDKMRDRTASLAASGILTMMYSVCDDNKANLLKSTLYYKTFYTFVLLFVMFFSSPGGQVSEVWNVDRESGHKLRVWSWWNTPILGILSQRFNDRGDDGLELFKVGPLRVNIYLLSV